MVHKRKTRMIRVDMSSLESIKKAEILKMQFENKGLALKSTRRTGVDVYLLTYK